MRKFFALSLIVFAFTSLLIAQPTTPTADSTAACTESAGHTERGGYRSEIIQTNMFFTAYLPPCYEAAQTPLPVIYLMHGSASTDSHWGDLGLVTALDNRIASGELPPLVVVLPFGEWIANENQFDAASWENIFLTEFLPLIEATYNVATDSAHRSIGGISRGGFWAFEIGLRHPHLFGSIGGHSAFFDLNHAPDAFNPLDLARTIDPDDPPRIWLDRGINDYAAPGLDIMHARLDETGIPHQYVINPQGEHNDAYWSSQINAYIDFYVAPWQQSEVVAATPKPTPPPTDQPPRPALAVYLPAVPFPSLQASIDRTALAAILDGQYDAKLTLPVETLAALAAQGVTFHADTPVLDMAAVYTTLWRDRTRWTILPFDALTPRWRPLWIREADGAEVHPLDMLTGQVNGDYPLAYRSEHPNFDAAKLTRILLSGVTAITRDTRIAFDDNGVDWAAEDIKAYTSRADFFHTSNEVSLYPTCPTTEERTYGGGLSFCSKAEHFELFTQLGLDIVELSGNHNNDFGFQPYLDTLAWYADHNIQTVGGGATLEEARRPLILEHNGNSVAWLSCNWVGPYYAWVEESETGTDAPRPGAAPCDRDWLRTTLAQLHVEHNLVILTLQYWEFDQHPPTPQQRADFNLLAGWGADVVVGTQAHFPQTYAFAPGMGEDESFVHFGLGNFYFDQEWWAGARFNLDQLYIYNGTLQFVDVLPGIIEDNGRPRPMTPEERENFWFVIFSQHGGM